MTTNAPEEDPEESEATEHLDDLEEGCGCAELWEHLSDIRNSEE